MSEDKMVTAANGVDGRRVTVGQHRSKTLPS